MLTLLLLASCLNAPDLSPVLLERPCDEPNVAIVSQGRAQMPIVAMEGARERAAALYLATTIQEITGVRPTIYIERPSCLLTNSPALRIAQACGDDSFRVITKKGSVHFLGRSDFAVYDWCERVLGVRNYSATCKTFPHSRELIVAAVDYADKPVFRYRKSGAPKRLAQLLKCGGTHRGGVNVHAPHKWFADPDVRTNHPNIFARQPDGSRGEMPLLCYGNPETLAYYEQRIDEHIAGVRDSGGIVDDHRRVITVSHWDVRLECTCEHCQRLFDPSLGVTGSGSPIIWGYFLKRLAQWAAAAHPDYTIAFLPYLNVCDVPKGLDLTQEGNCEAMVCSMSGMAMFKEPDVREREEALIRDWARVTGRPVINWHYGCWPREFTSAPYLYGATIVEHYRRMAPYETGSYICGGRGSAAEELSIYIWLKALWNPALDVAAIYDAYAARVFGPAAPSMRQLMTLQEEGWNRRWPWTHCCYDNTFGVSYTPDDVAEMKRLLGDVARVKPCMTDDFAKFFAEEAHYRKGVAFEPLVIPVVADAPKVDGHFDEAGWQRVPARAFVSAFCTSGAKCQAPDTFVRAVRTDKGVYFAFNCQEPNRANLNLSAAYGELKSQDTLELFIDASGTKRGTCHRLMFDVRNRMSVTADDVEWRAKGVVSAVVRDAHEWRVEVFVPFESLSGEVSREHWRGNFTRWNPARGVRTRLSTLGSEWNQERDAFTEFQLMRHCSEVEKTEL